mgnify:CR=1 FL=1
MGFFDKVKNMFTEEVEDDVKVEQVKKEVTHVSIESPKVEKIDLDDEIDMVSEDTFSKPVFFDDNDFEDLNLTPKVEKPKFVERDIFTRKEEEEKRVEEKKVFKPTPIISPVYGILDKNYHKEDIVSRTEVKQTEQDVEPSIDSIRNKAYGTLEDELENTLFGNNSILFKQIKEEKEEVKEESIELERLDEDALTNLTDDISKELDELLTKKEKYLEKEDTKPEVTDDLLEFIDSTLYKDGDEE